MKSLYQALFAYVLNSSAPPSDRVEALAVATVIPDFPYAVVSERIIKAFTETGEVLSYDYLVETCGFSMSLEGVSQADIQDVVGNLKEAQLQGSLQQELQAVIASGASSSEILAKIQELHASVPQGSDAVMDLSMIDFYEKRKTTSVGLLTGIKQVDDVCAGLELGTMLILGGYTGSMKTTTCLAMLYYNMINLRYNILYISIETPKELIMYQLLARHTYNSKFGGVMTPLDHRDIRKAFLEDEEEKALFDVVEKDLLANPDYGKFFVAEEREFESMDATGIRRFAKKNIDWPIDCVVIDYIQLLQYQDHSNIDRRIRDPLNHYVREFTRLANDFFGRKVLVIVVSQFNRESWKLAKENGHVYNMTAFAEANELERSSYYAMALYSDEELKESNELSVQLLKHRGGETIETPFLVPCDPRFCLIGEDDLPIIASEDDDFMSLIEM